MLLAICNHFFLGRIAGLRQAQTCLWWCCLFGWAFIAHADELESTIHKVSMLNEKLRHATFPSSTGIEIVGSKVGSSGSSEQTSKTLVIRDDAFSLVYSLQAVQDQKLIQIDLCNPQYVARIESFFVAEGQTESGSVNVNFDTGLAKLKELGCKFKPSALSPTPLDSAARNRMVLDRALAFLVLQADRLDLAIGEWKKGRATAELVTKPDKPSLNYIRFSKLDPSVFNNVLDSESTLSFGFDRKSHLIHEYGAETRNLTALAVVKSFVDASGVQVPKEVEFHGGEPGVYLVQKWDFIDPAKSNYSREQANLAYYGIAESGSEIASSESKGLRSTILGGIAILCLVSLFFWYRRGQS